MAKNEGPNLEQLWLQKRQAQETRSVYWSSTVAPITADLGTVEADASGEFGRWENELFRGERLARLVSRRLGSDSSILDVGGGALQAATFFSKFTRHVDAVELAKSAYLPGAETPQKFLRKLYLGDFQKIDFQEKYDLVWCSHVLEHAENVGRFVKKLIEVCREHGTLAIVVPPRKPFIVSGHLNLFNPGLLIYRLVMAGLDCSDSAVFQYDNNVCAWITVRLRPTLELRHDIGDIELLSPFFPMEVVEGFLGDFMSVGMSKEDYQFVFGPQKPSAAD